MKHVLWKSSEASDAPAEIKDRNGDVSIACCKNCGMVEIELDLYPTCNGQVKGVDDCLISAAQTYQERAPMYGDSWMLHGDLMRALFPNGLVLRTSEEFNRYAKVDNIAMKLARYCNSLSNGGTGHKDSAHDMIVYAAMLEVLTK